MNKLKLIIVLQLILSSSYAQEWENLGNGVDGNIYDLIVFEDNLYASGRLGPSSRGVYYWDGMNWNNTNSIWGIHSPLTMEVFEEDLYTSGDFMGSNGDPTKVYKWENGDWVQQGEEFIWADWNSVKKLKTHGNYLYAGGHFDFVGTNQQAKNIARWDGEVWQNVAEGIPGTISNMDILNNRLLVCHEIIDTVQINDTTIYHIPRRKLRAWDNEQWEDLDSIFDKKNVDLLRVIDNKLYFNSTDTIKDTPIINIGYWDGNSITSIGDTMFFYIRDIYEFNNELFAACQIKTSNPNNFLNVVRKFDGENWVSVGGLFNERVMTFLTHENNLVAGGFFSQYNNMSMSHIAAYSGFTSISENHGESNLEVYPNPVISDVKIVLENKSIKEINLHSLNGILVFHQKGINSKEYDIEFDYISTGTYIIEVITSDNEVFAKKIIKY